MRVVRAAAILVAVAVTAAGCTSESTGTPVAPSPTGTPSTEAETYGAPRVSDPLEASKFLTQPCAVLTPAQLAGFGVVEPGEADMESAIAKHSGPGCLWTREDTEHGSSLGMSFLTGNKHGLSDTYRGRDQFNYFVETTVDDYPAVFNEPLDGPKDGNCTVTVGITDTLTFRVSEVGGPRGQIVCDRTKEVAAAILATLKASA